MGVAFGGPLEHPADAIPEVERRDHRVAQSLHHPAVGVARGHPGEAGRAAAEMGGGPHRREGVARAVELLIDRRTKGTTRHVGSMGGVGHVHLSEGGETGRRTSADAMPAAIRTGPSVRCNAGRPDFVPCVPCPSRLACRQSWNASRPAMSTTVDPLVPLVLLEAVRTVDLPDDAFEAEFVEELRVKRFGLSETVRAQIIRYREAVRKGQRLPFEEAAGIARLIGRRPDAEAVFREAGRQLARVTYGRILGLSRGIIRAMPAFLARPFALGHVRHIAGRYALGTVRRVGATVILEVRQSVTLDTAPKSAGCAFYESLLGEVMRQFVGAVGMVDHVRCASRQEGSCEWRAEWSKVRR